MSHSTTQRSYLKDIQQLYRTIEKSTDGQASILSVNEMSVMISLHPKSGYNAHAAFTVKIKCPVSYPRDSPEVTFTSPIFHPNIDNNSGGICLNLLNEWLSCYSLLDVVKSLLYLIDNPNFDSANNSFAYLENRDLLAKKTMRVLAGLPVNGERYAPNKAWCEWAEAHGCLPVGEEEDDEENGEVPAVCVDVGQGSDDEDDGVSDVHASAYKDNGNGEFDGGAAVFDENVLSFANMRFVVASEKDSQDSPAFEREYTDGYFETQRILVWPPADSPNTKIPSVFYFFEPLGGDYYWMKFHDLYNTLFTGDVLHSMQNNRESRQSSSLCPWFNFIHLDHYSYQSSATSFFDLTFFFSKKMLTRPILTNDFCPWSHVDGGGIWGILGGLFCERRRRQRSWTDSTSAENSVSGHDMAFLFNTSFEVEDSDVDIECRVDEKEEEVKDEEVVVKEMAEYNGAETLKQVDANEVEVKEDAEKLESSGEADSLPKDHTTCDVDGAGLVQSNTAEVEIEDVAALDQVNVPEDTQSFRSSETYEREDPDSYKLGNDGYITYNYFHYVEKVNMKMQPQWQWFFRQTRWPFRFAPQQKVDVSMHENRIPPWRASVGRLISDVYNFCERNGQMQNLILLDPMALSPLSPLLNLMRHSTEPKAHLIGVLWMTPIDALS
uniref:UBIQUITIN_CONJUGAT_2 domain-containing protein n=2 Tax=Mesocestoides corti TaxID=53468 RepID=A0A5K3FTG3_MESCO